MAAIRNEPGLDELPTEGRDPAGADLDLRSTAELVRLMGEADATVPHAVAAAGTALTAAIDGIVARLAHHRPAHRDPLALAAREVSRAPPH